MQKAHITQRNEEIEGSKNVRGLRPRRTRDLVHFVFGQNMV